MADYNSHNPIKIEYASSQWTLQSLVGSGSPPVLADDDEIDLTVTGTTSATIRLYGLVAGPDGWQHNTTSPSYWWTTLADGVTELPPLDPLEDIPLRIKVKVTRTITED